MISISTRAGPPRLRPAARSPRPPRAPRHRRRLGLGRTLAAQHAGRTRALGDQAQPSAAAGEQLRGQLLEAARRGGEGLLEGLPDLPVGVGDQLLELAQRGLEVGPLALELLDVGQRLGVLLLGQRVDRPELLAAAGEPLQARPRAPRAPQRQRLGGRLRRELEPGGELAQLGLGLGGLVAGALQRRPRPRSGPRSRAAAGRELRLLLGAGAQLGGHVLARLAVGGQRGLEDGQLLGDRRRGRSMERS